MVMSLSQDITGTNLGRLNFNNTLEIPYDTLYMGIWMTHSPDSIFKFYSKTVNTNEWTVREVIFSQDITSDWLVVQIDLPSQLVSSNKSPIYE